MVSRKALRFGALSVTLASFTAIASAQHNNPQLLRTKDVSISVPFTPFGNTSNFNKFGDDGSSCVLDASGVLIWVDAVGNYRTIPNSELATPLYVSNNEILVWKNHFADYDLYTNKPDIQASLYRADASGVVTEVPIVLEGKELLDTAVLTTTSGAFTLVTTQRFDNGNDIPTIAPTRNIVDDIVIRTYRVGFSGSALRLSQLSRQTAADWLNYANTQVGPNISQLGWGSDGSLLFRNPSLDANFVNQVEYLWANSDGKVVIVPAGAVTAPVLPTATARPMEIQSTLYLSNTRLVYYRPASDNNGNGTNTDPFEAAGYYEVTRNPTTGTVVSISDADSNKQIVVNASALAGQPPGTAIVGTPLSFPKVTRVGYDQYAYTYTTAPLASGGTIYTYKLSGASGANWVRGAQLPLTVTGMAGAEVKAINPDPVSGLGAAIAVRGEVSLWLNSAAGGYIQLPAASNQAEPMFVADGECVVWDNGHAPPDGTGQHPLVVVRSFVRTGAALTPPAGTQIILPPNVAGNGPGRVILDTPDITLNPDTVGWTFTTAEKPNNSTARFRTYRLRGPDTDGDGLDNVEEGTLGTNPNLVDTDGDGLSDYAEVRTYLTNPLLADSDGDGISDGQEVAWGTNPLDINDPRNIDSDGDGLTDYQELFATHTNRFVADTDGDGLLDGEEVTINNTVPLNPIATNITDPLNPDTDGDGVSDGVEVKVTHTDPNVPSFGGNPGSATDFTSTLVNGSYTGLVFDNFGKPIGTLTVKVTNRGAFTGTEQGIGSKGTLRGSFDSATGINITGTTTIPGVTGVEMQLVQDGLGNYQIQGHFNSAGGVKVFELRRAAYSRFFPTLLAGTYTFGASSGIVSSGPTGDLVGTATVTADGKMTAKVCLPDNQSGTYSGTVNFGDLVPFFSSATTNARIAVTGNLVFRDIPGSSDFDGTVQMVRLPGFGADVYNPGYDHSRALEGSRFNSSALIGLASFPVSTDNVLGQFTGGAVAGDSIVATWAANGQITTPRNNIFAFSGKYDKRSGLITSTYSLTDLSRGLSNAKALVRAVPIQKQDRIAGQYYLPTGGGQFTFIENSGGTPPVVTTITPHGQYVPVGGKSYPVQILTPAAWTATVVDAATTTWVTLDVASGTGDGAVTITVAANATGLKRTAQVMIAGQMHVVQQDYH